MGKPPKGTSGKRPPAPSVSRRSATAGIDIRAQIATEIYTTLERLDPGPELLAIFGSWRDTLDDAEVLSMLREYNATGRVLHRPQ
jgi:hypothetical protein